MKKQEKKKQRPKSFRAIAVRVLALALCMWLGFAGLLTWTVSEDMFQQVKTDLYNRVYGHRLDLSLTYPGRVEFEMIRNLSQSDFSIDVSPVFPFALPLLPESKELGYWGEYWDWTDVYYSDYDHSVVFFDTKGKPLMTSGNRMTFEYTDAESWQSAQFNGRWKGVAWIDLDTIDGAVEILKPHVDSFGEIGGFMPVIRLTGWFEGNEFHPVTMERGWSEITKGKTWYRALNENNDLDRNGTLNWETVLTVPAEPGQELVTIYGWGPAALTDYEPKPVTVDGTNYESLTAWRLANNHADNYYPPFVARGLFETIISCTQWCYNENMGAYYYSHTVRFNPLWSAMRYLAPIYGISALVMVLALIVILAQIWLNLTMPLGVLIQKVKSGKEIYDTDAWAETHDLEVWCSDTRQALLEAQTEITRLNTALDYAKDAEEYRKQLISNITHELKTPLAVIHTYTEGLQSEIAPEKKERYMQVILDEAERMDGMVMQMLELSRLEAGRVKLNMERFDLGAVIRNVAQRFEPMMAEKDLKLRLDLVGEEEMNGDEARMEQVITNFMSNAVKYSTPGGEILVKAISGKTGLYFHITNNAKHLSEEGLNKVFDSFYREDAARTEKSTGLGLAIVKQILNLHGLQCYVNNTTLNDQPAVEFSFHRAE